MHKRGTGIGDAVTPVRWTIAACMLVTATTPARADESAATKTAADKDEAASVAAEKDEAKKAEEEAAKTPEPKPVVTKPNTEKRAEDEGKETRLPSVGGGKARRYAEKGVKELGGAVSITNANVFTQIGVQPTFGWFFIDYVQLSLLPSVEYVKTFSQPSKSRYSVLLEPSFHAHVGGPVFVFFGAGGGVAYERETGGGLAIAPRIGLNFLIGGSGVLKLAASYVFTATKRTAIEDGSSDKHTSTFGLSFGCTVAW